MPIYEYQCEQCDHRLEAFQKINDEHLKQCPECGREALRRLISAAAFQLKGSGWYVTDFRNSGKRQAGQSDGKEQHAGGKDSKDSAAETKAPSEESKKGGTGAESSTK